MFLDTVFSNIAAVDTSRPVRVGVRVGVGVGVRVG